MDIMSEVFADYPEYFPDLECYSPPNCTYMNVDNLHPYICSLSLSILMLNIRSLKKNFIDFIAYFYNYVTLFSCIVFTETWLTEERDKSFTIPGFYSFDLYRNQYGGGLKLYIKNCFKARLLNNFTVLNDLSEILTIELSLCNCKFLLMVVYHPPSSSSTKNFEFVDLFTFYLKSLLELGIPLIVSGDMNLNLLNPSNLTYIDIYINNLLEQNMRPTITRPTRVNLNNQTIQFSLLDQIWVSQEFGHIRSFVFPVNITDHFPVCLVVENAIKNKIAGSTVVRVLSQKGKETFKILLSCVQIHDSIVDMNSTFEYYFKQVFEAYCSSFPLAKKVIKHKSVAP